MMPLSRGAARVADPFDLQGALAERTAQGLYRQRACVEAVDGVQMRIEGRDYLNFASNDYLGAASQPVIREAWAQALQQWPAGSGASPLVTGYTRAHQQLEAVLAEWLEVEAVLLFSSGFAANQAVIKGLLKPEHALWQDRLNHASLQEAGHLQPCRQRRFRHNDMAHLAQLMTDGRGLVVSEGVFSMDGDQAPCAELLTLVRARGNALMVDDAHGLGVHGVEGRGTLDAQGLSAAQVDVLMGTFGKAIGTGGAFVAGSRVLVDYLVNFARDYVYSTHLSPAQAAATTRAIGWVRQANRAREQLQTNIAQFRAGAAQLGLQLLPSQTAIQPLILGESARAMRWASALREAGCWVGAMRPPTVPAGAARLRSTLSAAHTSRQIHHLLGALCQAQEMENA